MIMFHSPFFCYGLSWKTKYYEPITLLLLRRVPNLTGNGGLAWEIPMSLPPTQH